MRDFIACSIQCAIAIVCGAPIWLYWAEPNNPEGRVLGTLLVGATGAWLVTRLYARIRYGKGAKISMD